MISSMKTWLKRKPNCLNNAGSEVTYYIPNLKNCRGVLSCLFLPPPLGGNRIKGRGGEKGMGGKKGRGGEAEAKREEGKGKGKGRWKKG